MEKIHCPKCHDPNAYYNPLDGKIICPRCGVYSAPDYFRERLGLFLRDLKSAEVLPCGCWVNRRTYERFWYCPTHLQSDEGKEEE